MKKNIRRKKIIEVIQEQPITTPSNLASVFMYLLKPYAMT